MHQDQNKTSLEVKLPIDLTKIVSIILLSLGICYNLSAQNATSYSFSKAVCAKGVDNETPYLFENEAYHFSPNEAVYAWVELLDVKGDLKVIWEWRQESGNLLYRTESDFTDDVDYSWFRTSWYVKLEDPGDYQVNVFVQKKGDPPELVADLGFVVGSCLVCVEGPSSQEIRCGDVIEGSTIGAENKYDNYQFCFPDVMASAYFAGDDVYRLEIENESTIALSLTMNDLIDLDLFLIRDRLIESFNCPSTGLAISAMDSTNTEEIIINLEKGTYWIIVDGKIDSTSTLIGEGSYTLSVLCNPLPTICDLEATIINNSTPIFGSFDAVEDEIPASFYDLLPCTPSASESEPILGRVFLYHYRDTSQDLRITLSNVDLDKVFLIVFNCEGQIVNRSSICIGRAEMGVFNHSSLSEGFYQILVFSTFEEYYEFEISGENCCGTRDRIKLNFDTLRGSFSDYQNDFDFNEGDDSTKNIYSTCYNGNRKYDGSDFILDFDAITLISSSLSLESNAGAAMFLFDYQCGENCLGFFEIPDTGGIVFLELGEFARGRYRLIIDQAKNIDNQEFTIVYHYFPFYLGVCESSSTNASHSITFQNLESLLEYGDNLLFDFKRQDLVDFNEIEVDHIGRGPTHTLYLWDTFEMCELKCIKCGYEENEQFRYKLVKKSGAVAELNAFYEPEDGIFVTATNRFKSGGSSLIRFLTVDSLMIEEKLWVQQNKKRTVGNAGTLQLIVGSNTDWLVRPPESNWMQINPLSGRGIQELEINVDAHSGNETRKDSFLIVGPEGLYERIVIEQIPQSTALTDCAQASINISIDEIGTDSGEGDGSIEITASGGQGPYNYVWNSEHGHELYEEDPTDLIGGLYSVSVTDQNGCMSTLDSILVRTISAQTNLSYNQFNIYPNPNNGSFVIHIDSKLSIEDLDIYNTLGEKVPIKSAQNRSGNYNVLLQDVKSGIYSLRIKVDSRYYSRKFVIH